MTENSRIKIYDAHTAVENALSVSIPSGIESDDTCLSSFDLGMSSAVDGRLEARKQFNATDYELRDALDLFHDTIKTVNDRKKRFQRALVIPTIIGSYYFIYGFFEGRR